MKTIKAIYKRVGFDSVEVDCKEISQDVYPVPEVTRTGVMAADK